VQLELVIESAKYKHNGRKQMYRQGDVLLIPVNHDSQTEMEKISTDGEQVILAEGEATGHAHRIVQALAALYVVNQMRILYLEKEAKLQHEEHSEIILPPGYYQVVQQREYTPEGVRNVLD
jgi:hypothetical protein